MCPYVIISGNTQNPNWGRGLILLTHSFIWTHCNVPSAEDLINWWWVIVSVMDLKLDNRFNNRVKTWCSHIFVWSVFGQDSLPSLEQNSGNMYKCLKNGQSDNSAILVLWKQKETMLFKGLSFKTNFSFYQNGMLLRSLSSLSGLRSMKAYGFSNRLFLDWHTEWRWQLRLWSFSIC